MTHNKKLSRLFFTFLLTSVFLLSGFVVFSGVFANDKESPKTAYAAGTSEVTLSLAWLDGNTAQFTGNLSNNTIRFTNAQSTSTFYLSGFECTATWMLNMTLNKTDGSGGIAGTYEGTYSSTVTYDLTNVKNGIKDLHLWKHHTSGFIYNDSTLVSYTYNPGTWSGNSGQESGTVKVVISAATSISGLNTSWNMIIESTSSNIGVSVQGMAIQYYWYYYESNWGERNCRQSLSFSGDSTGLYVDLNIIDTWGYDIGLDGKRDDWTYPDDIRSDRVRVLSWGAFPLPSNYYGTLSIESASCDVTFNTNGGTPTPAKQTLIDGEKVKTVTEPSKSGRIFMGWYNGEKKWDFNKDTVSGNTTLTAKWGCTVTFDAKGGANPPAAQTVIENQKATKPTTDPIMYEGDKRGFVGWYNGDKKWDFTKDTVTNNITLTAKWGYTVTFDTDGGTPTPPAQGVEDGGKATAPAEVKLGENKATGWYYGDKKWNFAQDVVTGNITLKAKYGWNVTFQTEHGSTPPMQLVAENGKLKEPTEPNYGGTLKFEGWYNGDKKWDFAKDTVKSDMTLKAKWKDGYIVDFDTDGGSSATPPRQILKKDEKVIKPADPTKDKYVFKGWYIDDFWGGTEWDFAKNFVEDKDFTLKAKWVEAYTVKYDPDGGTPAPPDHYVAKDPNETTDRTIKPKPADPKKDGYALTGWYYTNPNNGVERKWNFETDIVTDDITLKAKWEAAYTVTFDADGGTPAPPKLMVSKTGSLLVTKPADPKKKGFVIVGWNYIDLKLGVEREWNFAVDKVDGDITLSAKWTAAWTVTFNADGGTPAPSEQNILNGKTVTKVPDPKKESAVFVGWFVDEFSGKQWNFETDTVTKNIALKAKWEVSYTVTFDVNRGADSGSAAPEKQVLKKGDILTEPDAPTRKNHSFLGWYNGDKLWSFIFDTVTGDMTLKAKWQEGIYTVKFNADSGWPVPATQTVSAGDFDGGRVKAPDIPYKYGYRFLGWYNGDKQWNFLWLVTEDMTLKAKYEKVCYVTFDPAGGTMATGYDFYETPPKYIIYPPPTPLRNGYLFQGWYKGDKLWDFATDVVTDHMTLTAKWESIIKTPNSQTAFNISNSGGVAPLAAAASSDIMYVVSLDASGGLSAPAQQGLPENGTLIEPDAPTRIGYKFLGWYLGDKKWDFGNDRLTNALIKTVSTVTTASYTNVTFTAKWERLNDGSIAVIFNTDGGGNSPREQIIYGNDTLMPVAPPARDGYIFLGWYNGDTLWDFLSDTPTADITLTAKWAKIDGGTSENGTGQNNGWWIALICVSTVLIAGEGFAVYWFIIRKKKAANLSGKA